MGLESVLFIICVTVTLGGRSLGTIFMSCSNMEFCVNAKAVLTAKMEEGYWFGWGDREGDFGVDVCVMIRCCSNGWGYSGSSCN